MRPELMAPAGSFDALKAAVENGADAVYLGGKDFSARAYAANFDRNELEEAVNYAHARGVKVYVTVNTLLDDGEIKDALNYLHWLYNIGVDAVIIQDLGLLLLGREILPELELHASTQMTLLNSPGVKLVSQSGIDRVVLAREVSIAETRQIVDATGAEVETFIHGALCISYSGQCLMSSMIGGRSGNRGRCAQPCRMQYQLVDENGKVLAVDIEGSHLLSPRDLKSVELLPELIRAGIAAFKIEGRMKRPEYVAIVTKIYRQALDRALERPDTFTVSEEEARDLAQVFNREFTTGYLVKNQGRDLMSYGRPNNRGLFLGRIKRMQDRKAQVKLELPLAVGDGVEIWVSQGREGATIRKIFVNGKTVDYASAGETVLLELPKGSPGDRIFKTYDSLLMEEAKRSYTSPKEERTTGVSFTVSGGVGRPLVIKAVAETGEAAAVEGDFIGEPARKRPVTEEVLRQQLCRLGNTPYHMHDLIVEIEGEVMYPLSKINKLRRQAVERLKAARQQALANRPVAHGAFRSRWRKFAEKYSMPDGKRQPGKLRLAVQVGSLEACAVALEQGADRVIIGGEHFRSQPEFSCAAQRQAVQMAKETSCEIFIAMPRLWLEREKALVESYLRQVSQWQPDGILVGNLGSIAVAKAVCPEIPLAADYTLNVFNSYTIKQLEQWGIEQVTLSPELTFQQLARLHLSVTGECLVHGRIPLMLSEHCLVGALLGGRTAEKRCKEPCREQRVGLEDRMNMVFPVETDQYCRMHIHNPKELCLIEDLPRFAQLGIDWVRILAREKSPQEVERIVKTYRRVLDGQQDGAEAKEYLEKYSSQGFTKGHYYRGVL